MEVITQQKHINDMDETIHQRTLASAEDDNLTPQATAAIRSAATRMNASIASLVDQLSEPLKGKFLEIKAGVNTMLAGLPPTDQVPAATEANGILRQLLYTMQQMESMITHVATVANGSRDEAQRTLASIPSEVTKAIDTQVAAGTLFTKDAATKLANDAAANAATNARTAALAEVAKISTRRQCLATATLPIPADESVLAGEDAAFTAAQDKAKARVEKLKPFKSLSSVRISELAWKPSDSEFDATVALLTEATKGGSPAGAANPFIAPAPGGAAPLKARVGAC